MEQVYETMNRKHFNEQGVLNSVDMLVGAVQEVNALNGYNADGTSSPVSDGMTQGNLPDISISTEEVRRYLICNEGEKEVLAVYERVISQGNGNCYIFGSI